MLRMVKTSFVALAVFVACAVHVHGASDDVEVAWENFQVKSVQRSSNVT
jgi:hypothetical protein